MVYAGCCALDPAPPQLPGALFPFQRPTPVTPRTRARPTLPHPSSVTAYSATKLARSRHRNVPAPTHFTVLLTVYPPRLPAQAVSEVGGPQLFRDFEVLRYVLQSPHVFEAVMEAGATGQTDMPGACCGARGWAGRAETG